MPIKPLPPLPTYSSGNTPPKQSFEQWTQVQQPPRTVSDPIIDHGDNLPKIGDAPANSDGFQLNWGGLRGSEQRAQWQLAAAAFLLAAAAMMLWWKVK